MASTFNMIAPHTVIPKIFSGMPMPGAPAQKVANGGEPITQGAGAGGVRARQAVRSGESIEGMQQRIAADRAASNRSGYSMTGDTLFF